MAGVVATWSGIMKVAEKGGMISTLSNHFAPILHFLFPEIPKNSRALQYISANFVANFLGLGWAACYKNKQFLLLFFYKLTLFDKCVIFFSIGIKNH